MIRGAYTAISGMIAAQRRMDVLGNNIANVNTTGFKEALATQSSLSFGVGVAADDSYTPIGRLGVGTFATGLKDNWLQGPILTTGVPTDLALSGDGLFVIGTPTGPAYTRNGSLVLDATNTLTTQIGQPVLDVDGRPIVVPGGAAGFRVYEDGTVEGTGQRIALVAIPAEGVTRIGENLFAIAGAVTPLADGAGLLRQGALEGSNTDMAASMTELISIQRNYQLCARAYALQDGSLETTNGLGRVK
jgi:flagellar basal body rod protein FlgG